METMLLTPKIKSKTRYQEKTAHEAYKNSEKDLRQPYFPALKFPLITQFLMNIGLRICMYFCLVRRFYLELLTKKKDVFIWSKTA